jgi:hypothetical protein
MVSANAIGSTYEREIVNFLNLVPTIIDA